MAHSLDLIAQEFGTPTYVYDEQIIRHQYNTLKNAFKGAPIKLYYAMKALSNINILRILESEGSGIDAVSIEEVHLSMRAGFTPNRIMYTPNGVAFAEIQEAVELGVHINIDNLSTLEKFGSCYGNNVPVCIRINPHILAGGNTNISVGHIDSKFGISIHQLRHIIRIVNHYGMTINGLHMHTGSDILDPDVFLQGADLLFEAALHFPDLVFLDFGSGFKVPYKDSDIATDVEKVGKRITTSFNAFCKENNRELELWFEPGKYLVSQAGKLLVKTNVIKQTTSTVFAAVDSGQNHLLRPMMYNAYHTIENESNPSSEKKLYSVVGNICETDTLGYDRMISEIREGDILSIHNAGAYGFSMSNQYNSRCRPAEVLLREDGAHLIRRRETLEDLTRNEVLIEEVVSVVVE